MSSSMFQVVIANVCNVLFPFLCIFKFKELGFGSLPATPQSPNNGEQSDSSNGSQRSMWSTKTKSSQALTLPNYKRPAPPSNKKDKNDFIYCCKFCNGGTNNAHEYIMHVEKMHGKILYKCEVFGCIKTFPSTNGLRQHVKGNHASQLKCDICNYVCMMPASKDSHMEGHSKRLYICEGCAKTFTRENDKQRHWNYTCTENPKRIMRCKHCIANGKEDECEVPGAEPGIMCHLEKVHNMSGSCFYLFCHTLFRSESNLKSHNQKCTERNPKV